LRTPGPPGPRALFRAGWRLFSVPAECRGPGDAVAWFASPLHAEPSLEDRDGGTSVAVPRDCARGALRKEQELSSGMAGFGFVQVDDDLQREDEVPGNLEPDGEPVFGTPTGIYTMRSLPVRFTPHEPGLSGR
jgi:hypothetical protein